MEKVVVTGSYIPYALDAPAVPIKVIGAPQIEATGESGDLLEVIRRAMPQFVGNANMGSSNSNIHGASTGGGSQIRLRNVQTLVLIDGRRAPFSPTAATGGYNFVDVNSIPVSAVERIEVVSDGASATYGSDAVAGVVNIILKKDFQGVEFGAGYRMATQTGHWEERSGRAIVGAKAADTSLTVAVEWVRSDPMYQNERSFSADQTGKSSTFPGVVFDFAFNDTVDETGPGGYYLLGTDRTAPPLNTDLSGTQLVAQNVYTGPFSSVSRRFNLAPYVTLALGNEKTAMTVSLGHRISDSLEAFGDILYSKTDTSYQLAGQPIVGMPFTAAHVTDFGIGAGVTNPDHPENPFNSYVLVRNRNLNNPRQYEYITHTLRLMGGLRGQINDRLSWEGAINLNQMSQDYLNRNVINRVNLSNAIDAGTYNMFARTQDPAALALANIFGVATSKNDSALYSADIRLNGDIPDVLPAGPVKFAVGVESRKEILKAEPDALSYTIVDPNSIQYGQPAGWDGATTSNPTNVHRSVDAVFAQVRVPLASPAQKISGLYTLDLDVAARYEKYSGKTGSPFVPKVLLRYLPFDDQLAFRASFSKSFSAPDLFALYGPTGVGYTDQIVQFQRADGAIIAEGDQAFSRVPSNPELKPERATNYNLGLVYSPRAVKGLTVETGYFRIEQSNVVGAVSTTEILQSVELLGTASPYADRVLFGSFNGTPVTGVGQVSAAYDRFGTFSGVFVTDPAENFVHAIQDGVDFRAEYAFNVERLGQFDVELVGLWYNRFAVEGTDYVGTTNGQTTLNGGTLPRWQANLRTSWERGNWGAGFNAQYIPSVTDQTADPLETRPGFDSHVGSFFRLDIWGRYRFRGVKWMDGLTLRVGVNNVLNRMPPLAASSWTDANADIGTYGYLGRVIYVDASYKF